MADRYNRDAAVRERVERALDDLFAQVLAWGGVITGEHGLGLAKKRWWPEATSEVSRDLHRRLKQPLVPDGIFIPGKFLCFPTPGALDYSARMFLNFFLTHSRQLFILR